MQTESQASPDLRSLDDALRLLRKFRKDLAPGSLTIWRIVDHACKHIEDQIAAELIDQSEFSLPENLEARSIHSIYFQ
jgi:hypothetical protein